MKCWLTRWIGPRCALTLASGVSVLGLLSVTLMLMLRCVCSSLVKVVISVSGLEWLWILTCMASLLWFVVLCAVM